MPFLLLKILPFLKSNWKIIIGFLVVTFLCYKIYSFGYHNGKLDEQQNSLEALTKQEVALKAQCDADKKLTKEFSDDLQKKLSLNNDRLNELKRLRGNRCIVPTAKPTQQHDGSSERAVLAGADGVTSDALYEFAAEAERYRSQLISCQSFVTKVWEKNTQ